MTFAEIRKRLTENILNEIEVITDDDFKLDKTSKYQEPLFTYYCPDYSDEDRVEQGYISAKMVFPIVKKFKSENIITDFDFVVSKDRYKHPFLEPGFYTSIMFTKSQAASFGKPIMPRFDLNTGKLEFKGHTCLFRRNSKQYKLMQSLAANQGKLVPLDNLAAVLWPGTTSVSTQTKINLYDTLRKIKDKLKLAKITENIFLETNDGFGLKN